MSIFSINLIEHFGGKISKVGQLTDVSKIGKVKVKPPSVRAKGISYDNLRRAGQKPSASVPKAPKAPKAPAAPVAPKAPKAPSVPVAPKAPKAPSAPAPPKAPSAPAPPKAPSAPAPPKAIDDLKNYTKDMGQKIQNTVDDLDKLKTVKLEDWKFIDELGESGKVAKQIDKGGSAIPKGSSIGKVEADEITSNLKKLEVDPPKNIDDATAKIKKTSDRIEELGKETDSGIINKTTEWVKNNKKLVGGVVLGATIVGGIAIAAAVKEKQKSDDAYNIVSIDDISTSSLSLAKVTFTPGEKISKNDYLMFSGTNCYPPLPPDCEIYKIDSDFQVQVIIPQKLTSNGTSGTMKIKTSFDNQFSLILTDTTEELANITANVTGEIAGAIVEGAVDITKEVAGSFWESLGLPDLTEYWWVLLIICILFLLSSSALVALQVM